MLLAAYATPVATFAAQASPGTQKKSPPSNFNLEWAKLVAAAKEEGNLVIVGGQAAEDFQFFYKAFGQKFGIKVTTGRGSASSQAQRLLAERRAGRYSADILISGIATLRATVIPAGGLDPIKPLLFHPEVVDESLWRDGFHRYADPAGKYIFVFAARSDSSQIGFNTKLVRPGQIQSYWNLLDPKWRGKIISFHPRESAGRSPRTDIYYQLGEDFLRRFYGEAKPWLVSTTREVGDGVASGAYPIAFILGPARPEIETLHEAGLPVAIYKDTPRMKKELVRIAAGGNGSIAVLNRPANPNAQKLFVNWLLTREGQTIYQQEGTHESLRTDISHDVIDPVYRLPSGPIDINDVDPDRAAKEAHVIAFMQALREKLGL
jgi:ABC-type Fe3+ transport system substrate-binding protein